MKRSAVAALTACLLLGAAPQALAQTRSPSAADPWEPANRFGFRVFMALDKAIIRPAAVAYQRVLPKPVRAGIHNVLINLGEPVVGMNDLFQGHIHQATDTTVRFVTNSTIGVGGVFDMAGRAGLPHHDNGFDLTLGRYHVQSGPFLFIPVLGPSSVRDVIGICVDGVIDPLHWVNYPHRTALGVARTFIGGVDTRATNDAAFTALLSDATDPYATLRSVYLQNEQSQIDQGKPAAEQPLPDFDEDQKPAVPPVEAQPETTPRAADAPSQDVNTGPEAPTATENPPAPIAIDPPGV